ncbi:phage terminase large subunit [Pacificispira sp.]|uniref:phage terminase large subunit n=1 Tax=Pacificispira sp. TaxID=2888761 RepID=UPI003BAB85D3
MAKTVSFREFLEVFNVVEDLDTPQVHADIADWLETTQDDPRRTLMAFRHCGKSHLVCLYVAWRLYVDPNLTILVISAKQKLATRNAQMMRKVIETHPLTKSLVPAGDAQWQTTSFTVNRPKTLLNPSVNTTSMDSDFIGMHADLIIGDDIETKDSVATEDKRLSLREKLYEFPNLADHHLFVGTPHHADSIYSEQIKRGYNVVQFPIYREDEDGNRTYLWPEKFGERKTAALQSDMSTAHFESQMLLIPRSVSDSLIMVEMIRDYDEEIEFNTIERANDLPPLHYAMLMDQKVVDLVGYVDQASGKAGRDRAVLSVVARDQEDRTFVVRVVELPPIDELTGFEPQALAIIETLKEVECNRVVVETGQLSVMESEIRKAGNKLKYRVHIQTYARRINKVTFIAEILEPIVKGGRLYLHRQARDESHFMEEITDFPHGKSDDCIDATAGAIFHLTKVPTRWLPQSRMIDGIHRGNRSSTLVRSGSSRRQTIDALRKKFVQTRR